MFKTNQYFDGTVVSIGLESNEGTATVGVMAAGETSFNVGKAFRINASPLYQMGVTLSKKLMRAFEGQLERNPILPKWDILIRPG